MKEDEPVAYKYLSLATLSSDFLLTNSCTHATLYGAISELIDNAKDANATRVSVGSVKSPPHPRDGTHKLCLYVVDNGVGMNEQEVENIVSIGHSNKANDKVGKYGNGLKAASMRIGADCLVLTKQEKSWSALFLSKTFTDKQQKLFVPMPHFKPNTLDPTEDTLLCRFEEEMKVFRRYLPWNDAALLDLFSVIQSPTGTLVIIFNIRLDQDGNPELNFDFENYDILIDKENGPEMEANSFRRHLSTLYYHPTMKIKLLGKDIHVRRLANELLMAQAYSFDSKIFKDCIQKESAELTNEVASLKLVLQEVQAENTLFVQNVGKELVMNGRKLREIQDSVHDVGNKLKDAEIRLAALNKHKEYMPLIIGINAKCPTEYGAYFYSNGRLIQTVKPKCQNNGEYVGVVAIVNTPHKLLAPTQNKQAFNSIRDRNALLRVINDHIKHFWRTVVEKKIKQNGSIEAFWKVMGFASPPIPSDTLPKKIELMSNHLQNVIFCELCNKWQKVQFSKNLAKNPDAYFHWNCSDNPKTKRGCSQGTSQGALDPPIKAKISFKDLSSVDTSQISGERDGPNRGVKRNVTRRSEPTQFYPQPDLGLDSNDANCPDEIIKSRRSTRQLRVSAMSTKRSNADIFEDVTERKIVTTRNQARKDNDSTQNDHRDSSGRDFPGTSREEVQKLPEKFLPSQEERVHRKRSSNLMADDRDEKDGVQSTSKRTSHHTSEDIFLPRAVKNEINSSESEDSDLDVKGDIILIEPLAPDSVQNETPLNSTAVIIKFSRAMQQFTNGMTWDDENPVGFLNHLAENPYKFLSHLSYHISSNKNLPSNGGP